MNFDKLTEFLDSVEDKYGIPFADCAVMHRHEMVFRHMTGRYDAEKKQPTNVSVLYRLFSATKMLTCIAVMQLAEQGKLGLYDMLCKYLPEFSVMHVVENFNLRAMPIQWPKPQEPCHIAHNSIRIIDLLTMTAGLSYDTAAQNILELRDATGGKGSTREMMQAISKMPLLYEPGTHWAYSLAHDVLAAVVEVVSGQKFSEYLRENIFEPLNAGDFYFHPDCEAKRRIGRLYTKDRVTGAVRGDDGIYSGSFVLTDAYESGGAGLITTVDAYSKVIDALSCGGRGENGVQILKPETVAMFTVPYTTGVTKEDFVSFQRGKTDYGYGLGVRVRVAASVGSAPLGEFGWDGAAGAYFSVDCQHSLSIVYAQHVMACMDAFDYIHPTIRNLVYEAMAF